MLHITTHHESLFLQHLNCSAVRMLLFFIGLLISWLPDSRQGQEFSPLNSVQAGSGANPASYPTDTERLFPQGVKRPGRDADHSPPFSAEV
jgi:hypothetical protein